MNDDIVYDHYIAVDWSIKNMAIARMTAKSNKVTVIDVESDIAELKAYLKNLKGTKALTIEESTPAQWLYVELRSLVDRIVICDPYRNKLLSEGPKTDRIDSVKLVQLLRAGLLKEVFHSVDHLLDLRRIVSAYEDLIKSGVRMQNQRYSLLRISGCRGDEGEIRLDNAGIQSVLDSLDRQIDTYEREKAFYEKMFLEFRKKNSEIRHQDSLPGIGLIGAVKIVSQVVAPDRFADAGHYLSYSGLIKLEKNSGGRCYGRKNSRYCRTLKSVYKTAALGAIGGDNEFNDYYEYLVREKRYADYNARHKVARRLAILSWGIFKSGKPYQRRRHVKSCQDN